MKKEDVHHIDYVGRREAQYKSRDWVVRELGNGMSIVDNRPPKQEKKGRKKRPTIIIDMDKW